MKLSLWQQFSSNHSAMYTIVGVFDTPMKALDVAVYLRKIVYDIQNWNLRNKMLSWQPNPIETQIAQEYGIKWHEPIDWLSPFADKAFIFPYQREPEEHITQVDEVVIVDAPGYLTWQTGHQFSNLINALGGKNHHFIYLGYPPLTNHNAFANFDLTLTITTPNEVVAHAIELELEVQKTAWKVELSSSDPIPWITYHPRCKKITNNLAHEAIKQLEAIWLAEHLAWNDFYNALKYEPNVRSLYTEFVKQDEHSAKIVECLRNETMLADETEWKRHNNSITLSKIGRRNIASFLPAFVTWLQMLGCVVEYQFEQDGDL